MFADTEKKRATDETWPGVTTLREYKQRFPQWSDTDLAEVRAGAAEVARKAGCGSTVAGGSGALHEDLLAWFCIFGHNVPFVWLFLLINGISWLINSINRLLIASIG